MEKILSETTGICPVCLRPLPASRVLRDHGVTLERTCPEHGSFRTLIWKNHISIEEWTKKFRPSSVSGNPACPEECVECGLCSAHLSGTCCIVLEVTDRCNLNCRYCFADNRQKADRSFEEICRDISACVKPGKSLIQLSGGEPTVRDDLAGIIRHAKSCGCKYVQLNSNGIRLSESEEYARELAEAGLSFVFLQFDGVEDPVYETLRGRRMMEIKEKAIRNCERAGLGVTLVPTLVPGVNTDQIGRILAYAVTHSPTVRGVHFQPVTYLGHHPEEEPDRYTLDELFRDIVEQSDGRIRLENLLPSNCDHPLCGIHADFIVMPDGSLYPLSKRDGLSDSDEDDGPGKNREFVGKNWSRDSSGENDVPLMKDGVFTLDGFLSRVRSHPFTVTAMAFQDAENLDLERLRSCSLHVFHDGKLTPFCAYYLRKGMH